MSKLPFEEIQNNKIQFCLLILVLKSDQFPMTLFLLATPEIIFSFKGVTGDVLRLLHLQMELAGRKSLSLHIADLDNFLVISEH